MYDLITFFQLKSVFAIAYDKFSLALYTYPKTFISAMPWKNLSVKRKKKNVSTKKNLFCNVESFHGCEGSQ